MNNVGHALGINVYHAKTSKNKMDKKLPKEFFRNNYCCCRLPGTLPEEFQNLLKNEFIETWEKFGNLLWSVTDKGIKEFRLQFHKDVTAKSAF